MTAKVSFDPAVQLPEEYNFTHFASYDDKIAVAEYLKIKYEDFIGIGNPQANIYGGDYNIYNQQMYSIEFFQCKRKRNRATYQLQFQSSDFRLQ